MFEELAEHRHHRGAAEHHGGRRGFIARRCVRVKGGHNGHIVVNDDQPHRKRCGGAHLGAVAHQLPEVRAHIGDRRRRGELNRTHRHPTLQCLAVACVAGGEPLRGERTPWVHREDFDPGTTGGLVQDGRDLGRLDRDLDPALGELPEVHWLELGHHLRQGCVRAVDVGQQLLGSATAGLEHLGHGGGR
ncbi:hypothetical protein [Actinacidiphila soli]|uniref:hypothetical protein n=1 Tax=Actinacidiphila soli TaxID=2487275 RepID=UPI001F0C7861|nr:hypothetical protein [Actinacidiphila soli]